MQKFVRMLFATAILGFASLAAAGPVEDVTQLGAARGRAFVDGDIEAFMAAVADNASFHSSLTPFRADGKDAIRGHFVELFERYPVRRISSFRQPNIRAYGNDLVVQDGYSMLTMVDQRGATASTPLRTTNVWVRVGGRWQIVSQHNSVPPAGN